ncbi:hypothetical protein [Shewanella japonica]|uniref:MFS transporter n=1 Tax=Shewanella japonica TaxID=93973 RepID=A0ABM6JNC5_9GAMM|nr:hypothetical protein [Shewanella japonica]ARD22976.1 hypothetical protein SJ2017_2689 [Shewanella japonica]
MSYSCKFILVFSFALAFFIPILVLGLSIIIATPLAIAGVLQGEFEGAFIPLLSIGGAMGFWGLSQLLAKTLDDSMNIASPFRMKIYISLGIASLFVPAFYASGVLGSWAAISTLPFLVTLYLVYFNRQYLSCS